MPFLVASVLHANQAFAGLEAWNPEALLTDIGDASTVLQVGERLGVFAALETDDDVAALRDFLGTLPRSLDAAIVAGMRDALGRGVRAQLTWQPGYDFELRMWEVSAGGTGLANVLLTTPHPPEPTRA
jgi:hypothetical protein